MACLLAFSTALHAQRYVFRNYGQTEGLKNLSVNALTMDRSGFLWVATENGVYRFLGSSFERFGPEQGIVEFEAEDIVADADGAIWVGTDQNLYRFNGQRFLPARQTPIPIERIRRIFVEDARHLLVVDKQRLYRLEHDQQGKTISYKPVIPDNLVTAIPDLGRVSSVNVVNDPGQGLRIWIGCGKRLCSWLDRDPMGPSRLGQGDVTVWSKGEQLAADDWESILLDSGHNLWAAGRKHVMVMLAGTSRFIDRSIPGSDPENNYGNAPLAEDREGRVLVPTEDGVVRWEGKSWKPIGQANGLQHISHSAGVAFDAAGDAWIGSHGSGVFHWFGYRDWEGWSDAQGLPSSLVWTIQPLAGGRVLAGTDSGPAWIDSRNGLAGQLSSTRPWKYGQVDGMDVDRDGSIWVGGMTGSVLSIDPRTGQTVETAKLPDRLDYALDDSKGRLFFTTATSGIFVRESPRAAPHRISAVDGLLGTQTRIPAACESPDGTVWFLAGNGLLRLQGSTWTKPQINGLSALHGTLLSVSCAANGAIWVTGEEAGTWRLTPVGDRLQAWKLEVPIEFRSISSVAILADRRGWVWLGTDSGLLVWNGLAWRQLTVESGLIWNDADQGALKEGIDGSLWVGTSGGVAHLLHPERVFDPVPLNISVTGVQRGDNQYPAGQEIALPWSNQQLQIQLSSSTMRNRSELVFRFRLDGLQADWAESLDGKAVFGALPPGQYTFMAMARNPGLGATSSTVQLHFRVLPPWWRTSWFFALCGLGLVFLLMVFDRLRVRRLETRSRQLEGMVQERTRELEASREQLRVQATHDGLTGLLNHESILRALAAEVDRARREKRNLVLAIVDLDHFKWVNDRYGHLAGDEALSRFADAITATTRLYDHSGRFGGEEFALVLTEIPREAVEQRLSNLHASISNLAVRAQGMEFKITCSIGAVIFDPREGDESVEDLLAAADQALYCAKDEGRNRVVFRRGKSDDVKNRRDREVRENRYLAEATLAALIESTDDIIFAVDLEYRMGISNHALREHMEKNLGLQVESGMTTEDDLHPEKAEIWIPLYDRALAEGPFRTEYILADGRTLELSLNPILMNGKTVGISVFGKEITETKLAERAIKEAEKKYRDIFDGTLAGMFQTTIYSRILTANHTLSRMLAYDTPEEMVTTVENVAQEVWADQDEHTTFMRQLAEDGSVQGFECRLKRKDGAIAWFLVGARQVLDMDGRFLYFEGFIEDISERKQAMQVLAEIEAKAAEDLR